MDTTTCLKDAIAHTHDGLAERLETARTALPLPQQSRRGCPPIDLFLSETSRHLHAVDQVMLPSVRDRVRGGRALLHDYLLSEKELGIALAHVKAREFGSTYERRFDWAAIWSDVAGLLGDERRHEEVLGAELDRIMAEAEAEEAAERLMAAEDAAPTRPHPYLPHTGAPGRASRRMMAVADRVWDTLEGRFVRHPDVAPHARPGLIGQYLLADPRFGEEETGESPESR